MIQVIIISNLLLQIYPCFAFNLDTSETLLILVFIVLEVAPLTFILYTLFRELGVFEQLKKYFKKEKAPSGPEAGTGTTDQRFNTDEYEESNLFDDMDEDFLLMAAPNTGRIGKRTAKGKENLIGNSSIDLENREDCEDFFAQSLQTGLLNPMNNRNTIAVMEKHKKPQRQFIRKEKRKWDDDEDFDKCIKVEEEDIIRYKSFCSEELADIEKRRATTFDLLLENRESVTAELSEASSVTEFSRLSNQAIWRETEVERINLRKISDEYSEKQSPLTPDAKEVKEIKRLPFKLGLA